MQRYFVPNQPLTDDIITMTSEDAHHITKVMRMKADSQIVCCFETGKSALCTIIDPTAEPLQVKIIDWLKENNELPVEVTIASGLPKGDKLEYIVQKGTELGAFAFLPFVSSRSITKWDEKKGRKKIDRLAKISKEAAEQSYRNRLPQIYPPLTFQKLIEVSKEYDVCIVAYEEEGKVGSHEGLGKALANLEVGGKLLAVFGAEGGLTTEEVKKLTEVGFIPTSLGPRILRTETAPLYVLSAVSFQFEL